MSVWVCTGSHCLAVVGWCALQGTSKGAGRTHFSAWQRGVGRGAGCGVSCCPGHGLMQLQNSLLY